MGKNIVEIAIENGNFKTLVAALQKANLVDTLLGEGPFTVFAPTDDAFNKLLAEMKISAGDLLKHPQLSKILLYHVLSGKIMSSDLRDGMEAKAVNGENLKVSLKGGVFINKSEVVTADIDAVNGVIHVINAVLMPANL